mmetsp:Transcript_25649/g.53297  ORF Transcript_25649/g.53297 Transcript_25649/m.53297 type:complete len:425 (+) Transcript_25649:823-2097(+)
MSSHVPSKRAKTTPPTSPSTLEHDKENLLKSWKAMGGAVHALWNGNEHDVSKWQGVEVGEISNGQRRIVCVIWKRQNLKSHLPLELFALSELIFLDLADNDLQGQIPSEIGNLSSLRFLNLSSNKLTGSIVDSIGDLKNLTDLYLASNRFTGSIPASLGRLFHLSELNLANNALSGEAPSSLADLNSLTELWLQGNQLSGNQPIGPLRDTEARKYVEALHRRSNFRYVEIGIAVTLKRQMQSQSSTRSLPPLFTFLSQNNDMTDCIFSFLDPMYCCVKDRLALLKISAALKKSEKWLRQKHGDDVAKWNGISVKGGRVVKVSWPNQGFATKIPPEFGDLTGLSELDLSNGGLTGDIPKSLKNLKALTKLDLSKNKLTGDMHSLRPLRNLKKLNALYLVSNLYSVEDVPPVLYKRGRLQDFFAKL